MLYVQQIRSRKRPLVPLNMDNEVKIEFLDVAELDRMDFTDNSNSSSASSLEEQMVEIITPDFDGETMDLNDKEENNTSGAQRPRKRAKLDHLSVEQKAQHRKMMNRISAQSARDRQRALMVQQEENIKKLVAVNMQLQQENKNLKSLNDKLLDECEKVKLTAESEANNIKEENKKLKSLIEEMEKKLKGVDIGLKNEVILEDENTESCCGTLEPAVLDTYPLLKGQSVQQISVFLLLMSAFSLWISTPQKFLELWKTSQNRSSVKIQNLQHWSRLSLMKQLTQLEMKVRRMNQKPPD